MGKYEDELHAPAREKLPGRVPTFVTIDICNAAGGIVSMTFDAEWLEIKGSQSWEKEITRDGEVENVFIRCPSVYEDEPDMTVYQKESDMTDDNHVSQGTTETYYKGLETPEKFAAALQAEFDKHGIDFKVVPAEPPAVGEPEVLEVTFFSGPAKAAKPEVPASPHSQPDIERGFEEGFLQLTGKSREEVNMDDTGPVWPVDIDVFDPYLIVWHGVDEGLNKQESKSEVVPRVADELITWLKVTKWFNVTWWTTAVKHGYHEPDFHDWVSRVWDYYEAERREKANKPNE